MFRLATLFVLLTATTARAHDPGLSSSRLEVRSDAIVAALCFNNSDLAASLGIDLDGDGALDERELRAGRDAVVEFATRAVRLTGSDAETPIVTSMQLAENDDVVLAIRAARPSGESLRYSLDAFDDLPRGHRHYVAVVRPDGAPLRNALLRAARNATEYTPGARTSSGGVVVEFFVLGVEHILIGFDHILFLLALLFGVQSLGAAAKLITAFTVGHSITLIAATLGWLAPPIAIVESIIALSVLFVAVENLVVKQPQHRWKLTLVFGLVHGFGFASVLRELGIDSQFGIAPPLVSFNVGVEVGQLAIAACATPLLLRASRAAWFSRYCRPGLNATVAVCGAIWLVQRTLGS